MHVEEKLKAVRTCDGKMLYIYERYCRKKTSRELAFLAVCVYHLACFQLSYEMGFLIFEGLVCFVLTCLLKFCG